MFADMKLLQGGSLQEYRIPLPFTVDEYRVGHDFTVVKSTLAEIDQEGPSGMNCELLSSERCSDAALGSGRHTKRRFFFGSRLPAIVQRMLGGEKALVIEEDAYTFYPYVEAVYACPLFGARFAMTIQTVYCESEEKMAPQHLKLLNAVRGIKGLSKGKTKTLDIGSPPRTSDGSMYNNVYVKSEDPREFGLSPKWERKMLAVKLVCIRLAIPLVGPMLQTRAVSSSEDLYHRLHRRSYCWKFGKDGWGTMKIADVRKLEQRMKKIQSKL
jgi:hypothetical protein